MKTRGTGRRKRREGWSNRLAIIGITVVVLSLALVVNIKNHSMEKKVMEYQAKEESLTRQVENEQKRAAELEERRVYVQTKQYIEEVAKQKLGVVKPDEVLLKGTKQIIQIIAVLLICIAIQIAAAALPADDRRCCLHGRQGIRPGQPAFFFHPVIARPGQLTQ